MTALVPQTLRGLAERIAEMTPADRAESIAWYGAFCRAVDRVAFGFDDKAPPVPAPLLELWPRGESPTSELAIETCLEEILLGNLPGDEAARIDVESMGYVRARAILPGEVVVDAGAHIGYFAEYASECVGRHGQVICFEPNDRNLILLRRRLVGRRNCQIFGNALGASQGIADLHVFASSTQHSLTRADNSVSSQIVKVVELDSQNLRHVDFLKIDVEGAEVLVLEGARATIERSKPHIVVEVHSHELATQVAAILDKYGYVFTAAEVLSGGERDACGLGPRVAGLIPRSMGMIYATRAP